MTPKTWLYFLLCAVLAFAYLRIIDMRQKNKFLPRKYLALLAVFALATVSSVLASLQKYIGSPIIGLFLGIITYNVWPKFDSDFKEGTTFAAKKLLSFGIILVGGTLNIAKMAASIRALPLIIFNIALSFLVAYLVGHFVLKQSNNICMMVGGGTCICGGTAIATLGSIIKAAADEIGYAMTAIFLFDILACLLYPYLAQFWGMTPEQFSFLAGTAINDTSSVTASAQQFASLAGVDAYSAGAISIKLVRTTMLIVVALAITLITVRSNSKNTSEKETVKVFTTIKNVFPIFILGFIGMSILNTLNLFHHESVAEFFKIGSKYLITCALVGVGFKMKVRDLFTKGVKPLLLGGCTWLCVAASSFLFINLFPEYVNQTNLF